VRRRNAARLKLRVLFEGEHSLGPGKTELLQAVQAHGSISAAARSMGMAYRHAWELIEDLNECFGAPVVATASGGRRGGGARLTPLGAELVRRFRAIERRATRAVARELAALEARTAGGRRPRGRRAASRSRRS
jgi:molybdate transport system regulatory protein